MGAIYRRKGGMALLGSIGLSVDTLLAVGQASSSPVLHMWVAHSLWLIANAVGLSYVPHVQVSFFNPHCARLASIILPAHHCQS